MKISVIIVSYNCKAFLDYSIQSVTKALKDYQGEIIVVDNCSSDGTVEFLKSKNYDLKIIENDINSGFSKANNMAAKLAVGEYLFFLNPDTIIPEDLISKFMENKKNDTGIFGFRMIDAEGSFLYESKRNFPSIAIILKKLFGFSDDYYSSLGEFNLGNVDVLCGANMIIKKSLFKEIKGFNEDYFMYGEDIQISYESFKHGFKNFYCGTTTLIHFKGESTRNDIKYFRNFYGAMGLYYKNVFSSNQILIFLIKLISNSLIFIKGVLFPILSGSFFLKLLGYYKFHPTKQKNTIQPKHNLLISNMPNNKLEKIFGNILLTEEIDEKLNSCNLIFDSNYLSFKEIISCVEKFKNINNINFWYLSRDNSFIIKASGMNEKGNAYFL